MDRNYNQTGLKSCILTWVKINRGLSEAKMVAFLWWTSTNIIQIMIPGPQMPPLQGLSAFDRKYLKIFYETVRPNPFDVWYVASPNGSLPSSFKL